MDKISYKEMAHIFMAHESAVHNGEKSGHLSGAIVFTENSFTKPYSLDSRTYLVSSDSKAYQGWMGGYSLFGYAKDGSDPGVRLDWYMAEEKGGKDGWKVDYCYLTEEEAEA